MKIEFRAYQPSDHDSIAGWWDAAGEPGPPRGAMVEDGTLVALLDEAPAMSLTVLFTQSKEVAYLEGFIAHPTLDPGIRKSVGTILWGKCVEMAKDRGCKTLITYAGKEGLVRRYEELGFTRSMSGLTALARGL